MDSRVPDGRTDHRVLRPRTAPRVPRCPRGDHRRDPSRPRRRGRAGSGRRAARCSVGARGTRRDPCGIRSEEPAPVRTPRRARPRLVPRASPLRQPGSADRGARMVVPRARKGAAAAHPGDQGDGARGASRRLPPDPGSASRVDERARRTPPARRSRARVRGALRRLRRDRSPLPRRSAPRALGPDGRERPAALLPGPGGSRLGALRPRGPPPLGGRARPSPHFPHSGSPDRPPGPRPGGHPLRRPPLGRLRPREHHDRFQRRRLLRVAGVAPPHRVGAVRASSPTWSARHRRCSHSTGATEATSSAPSTAATKERRSNGYEPTPGALLRPPARQVVPRCDRPGPASSCARSPHPADHRCARSDRRAAPAAVRRHHLRRDSARRTAVYTGQLVELPPIGEARALVLADYARGRGPRARAVDGLRRLCERSPDARSGRVTRSRSTPRRSSRRSPADAVGTSSTGRRRVAARGRRSRSGHSTAAGPRPPASPPRVAAFRGLGPPPRP